MRHLQFFDMFSQMVKRSANGIDSIAHFAILFMKADDRHFRITVPIAVSPQFYGWVFGLKNMATIESPQSVVDGMKEMLSAVEKRYEDSKGSQ